MSATYQSTGRRNHGRRLVLSTALAPDIAARVREIASSDGMTVSSCLAEMIEREVHADLGTSLLALSALRSGDVEVLTNGR